MSALVNGVLNDESQEDDDTFRKKQETAKLERLEKAIKLEDQQNVLLKDKQNIQFIQGVDDTVVDKEDILAHKEKKQTEKGPVEDQISISDMIQEESNKIDSQNKTIAVQKALEPKNSTTS